MSAADSGLGRYGETVWVAVLTCLCSLPLVTAVAAHAAALQALDPDRSGTPDLTARYWRAFRAGLGPGTRVQLVWLALAGVAAADLTFALLVDSARFLGPVVGALGAVGAVLLLLLRPWLAAALSVGPDADRPAALAAGREVRPGAGPTAGLPATCRRAVALAGVSPWRTLLLLAAEVVVVLAAALTLAALPFVLGPVLLLHRRLLADARRQLHRPRGLAVVRPG